MGKSKQNKQPKKDGNHRAETKEEKLERLRQQEEARQACFKILPLVGGGLLLFLILFGLYVRSVPPKVPTPKTSPAPGFGDINRILAENNIDANSAEAKAFADQIAEQMKAKVAEDAANDAEEPPAEAPADPEEGTESTEPNEERVEL